MCCQWLMKLVKSKRQLVTASHDDSYGLILCEWQSQHYDQNHSCCIWFGLAGLTQELASAFLWSFVWDLIDMSLVWEACLTLGTWGRYHLQHLSGMLFWVFWSWCVMSLNVLWLFVTASRPYAHMGSWHNLLAPVRLATETSDDWPPDSTSTPYDLERSHNIEIPQPGWEEWIQGNAPLYFLWPILQHLQWIRLVFDSDPMMLLYSQASALWGRRCQWLWEISSQVFKLNTVSTITTHNFLIASGEICLFLWLQK